MQLLAGTLAEAVGGLKDGGKSVKISVKLCMDALCARGFITIVLSLLIQIIAQCTGEVMLHSVLILLTALIWKTVPPAAIKENSRKSMLVEIISIL